MNKYCLAVTMTCLLLTSVWAIQADNDGKILFQRYCGRCHGESDKRSGSIVFHSKKTLISRYRHRSKQLLNKLYNIDKYSISNIMISAIHKIQDKKILILIVNYLSDPALPVPGEAKDKEVIIKEL